MKGHLEVPKCCPTGRRRLPRMRRPGDGPTAQPAYPDGMIGQPDAAAADRQDRDLRAYNRYNAVQVNCPRTASRPAAESSAAELHRADRL